MMLTWILIFNGTTTLFTNDHLYNTLYFQHEQVKIDNKHSMKLI
jgi:hypothetical protein